MLWIRNCEILFNPLGLQFFKILLFFCLSLSCLLYLEEYRIIGLFIFPSGSSFSGSAITNYTAILSHYLFLRLLGVAVERAALSLHGIRDGRERPSVLQLN